MVGAMPTHTWIDGHLDLADLALHGRDLTQPVSGEVDGCVSIPDLRAGSVGLALATIFTSPQGRAEGPEAYDGPDDRDGAHEAGIKQLAHYEELEQAGHLRIVRSTTDLAADHDQLKVVILMEGADPVRSPEEVAWWHERGLRVVGLTWALGTRYAGGNAAHGPLTDKGVELVRALDACGIIHDASHLADESLDGLLEHATGAIVATHSNCRALFDCKEPNERHLRDDHIRAIGERGGILGLNLFSRFLTTSKRATIDDCTRHIEHVCDVLGRRDAIALGSDADGGFGASALPIGLDHPTKWGALADALIARGWSEAEVRGFTNGNWRRFLAACLPD